MSQIYIFFLQKIYNLILPNKPDALHTTASGLAMAGHLSTKVEANFYAKYSENVELLPKALLAPNRCYMQPLFKRFY